MIAILLAAATYCGAERADVKTLSDLRAHFVERVAARCTVADLVRLPAPKWRDHAQRDQEETGLCKVSAGIVAYKAEDDNDIHVVLSVAGQTMIAEFPHPDCAGKGHKAAFANARRALLKLLRKRPSAKVTRLPKPVPVVVTGIVFFDKIHGQLGVAPNGIELHPVLKIERLP